MTGVVNADQLLAMSDDDFANMNPPEAAPVEQPEAVTPPAAEPVAEEKSVVEEPAAQEEPEETPAATEEEEEPKPDDKPEQLFDRSGKPIEKPEAAPAAVEPDKKPDASVPGSSEAPAAIEVTPENALAFYQKIMAPIKANGKEITLKSPEEALQLIQMGANYTRKMQAIAPHRKMLTMIQNNSIDEAKLDYLIALDKRDPEAIKQLIKDAGIDPLEIDTSTESKFRAGNHTVTDNEVALQAVMDDVQSTPHGQATIVEVNTNWDQASKEAIWENPEILNVINSQRENGIYDAITTELTRQKTLGTIPATTPFLKAYEQVGKQLYGQPEQNSQAPVSPTSTPPQAQPGQVVTPPVAPVALGTTVAAPKPQVANGDKAGAASPTRTTPRKAKEVINPLAMSDDDFLKQFEGRF